MFLRHAVLGLGLLLLLHQGTSIPDSRAALPFQADTQCYTARYDGDQGDKKDLQGKKGDDALVRALRDAVKMKIAFEHVEKYIGTPASFATRKPADYLAFRALRLYEDPEHKSEFIPLRSTIKSVLFYPRLDGGQGPRLVGIIYDKEGGVRVFFAVVGDG